MNTYLDITDDNTLTLNKLNEIAEKIKELRDKVHIEN